MPSVLKNPGVIGRTWLDGSWPSAGLGRSTRQKLVPMQANGTGRHDAPAACSHAGQRGDARQRFAEEAAGLGSVVARGRQLHRRGQHAVGAEAEIACSAA